MTQEISVPLCSSLDGVPLFQGYKKYQDLYFVSHPF